MGSYSRKRYATESASFPKSASSAPGSYAYATFAELPASGSTPGNTAFVVATNRLYIWSGVGWYLIATVTNASPTAITGVAGAYALAIDGTATTITAVSTDPEGFALTWSYVVSTGSLGSTATVAQADNVFTITPSTDTANAGTFSLTFRVTDGLNGVVSAVSAFTLTFSVANSRYTALSVKATAAGSNQTFDDASASNLTITTTGDVTASTFSPYRHGGYSLRFENSVADDNNIKFDNTTGSGAVAASGEFCVETWVKFTVVAAPAGAGNARIFVSNGSGSNAADNLQLYIEQSGSYIGAVTLYSNTYIYRADNASEVINDGEWHHLAVTRDSSNNLRWFVDGSLIATIASNTVYQFEETRLGKRNQGTGLTCFTGDMRDTRIVIGSSVYESAFTPPTTPLTAITNTYLLVGDLPYIKDESTNNFSIHAETYTNQYAALPSKSLISLFDNSAYSEAYHGTSAYFDGTGDYLSMPAQTIPTGNFTVEGWYYLDGTQSNSTIIAQGSSGNAARTFVGIESVDAIQSLKFQMGSSLVNGPAAIPDQWTHFCATYNGSAIELYQNGVSAGTTSRSGNAENQAMIIGRLNTNWANNYDLKGFTSDIRVSSVVRQSSNFTPPTAPLTTSPTYAALAIGVANSGASAYTLSGDVTGSNATVNIAIGQTVNFTVNASGHPFYIRVSNGGANVSTPAATGQGATSGVVSWTPNAAGTYYYQCGNHAGMIGTINVAEGVKFLLNPETSILDLSQKSALTCYGDAATSTTQVKFAGTKSIAFDGTGDYISAEDDESFSFGTGDFTVECWLFHQNASASYYDLIATAKNSGYMGSNRGGWIFAYYHTHSSTYALRFGYQYNNAFPVDITFSKTLNVDTWYHIAMTRQGNQLKCFVDGTQVGSTATNSTNIISTEPLTIGTGSGISTYVTGYMQDVRITKGLARYTGNFTPPTAELKG